MTGLHRTEPSRDERPDEDELAPMRGFLWALLGSAPFWLTFAIWLVIS